MPACFAAASSAESAIRSPPALSSTIRTAAAAIPRSWAQLNTVAVCMSVAPTPGGSAADSAGRRSRLAIAVAAAPSTKFSLQLCTEAGIGKSGPSRRQSFRNRQQLTGPESWVDRDAGPDPHRPPQTQLGQVGEHDRRARAAHPGRLDRQRPPRRRPPRVPPEAARVVAHLRVLQQLLGEQQGATGVAHQHRVGGDRRCRSKSLGHGGGPSCHRRRARPTFLSNSSGPPVRLASTVDGDRRAHFPQRGLPPLRRVGQHAETLGCGAR